MMTEKQFKKYERIFEKIIDDDYDDYESLSDEDIVDEDNISKTFQKTFIDPNGKFVTFEWIVYNHNNPELVKTVLNDVWTND
jgi:hypothetical protein